MTGTSYSFGNLQDHFYDHLHSCIKDELVHTACPVHTFNELITVTFDLDVQICQHYTEKMREDRHSAVTTRMTARQSLPSIAPLSLPFSSPNTMKVDTIHTCKELMQHMHGRCFGCSANTRTKKEGNHDHEVCLYCKCLSYKEIICMNKYMG